MAESLKVGSRVSIVGKETLGLGTIQFLGETAFQTGIWVGIALDKPGNIF
jgi:dynactin complex subunit